MPLKTEQFTNVTKLILKKDLSKNKETLAGYRKKIIEAYNSVISHITNNSYIVTESNQPELKKIKQKLVACLQKLKCTYNIETIAELVNENQVGPIGSLENQLSNNESEDEYKDFEDIDDNRTQTDKMEIHEFLRLASGQINKNYSGDPLSLTSFIDSLELLESLATTQPLQEFLFRFAKTKLEGRAREYITDETKDIQQLKNVLTKNIKPDNSKIIEGRMLGLRFNLTSSDEFAEKAEKLADSLRRTLIIEGVTPTKANEMSVEKTVELCRKNTHSDIIKSVLEASSFQSPKDVIAKMITQVEKTKQEAQVLVYNSDKHKGSNFQRYEGYRNYKRNYNRYPSHDHSRNQSNNNRGRSNNRYSNDRASSSTNWNSNIRVFTNPENEQEAPIPTEMGPESI